MRNPEKPASKSTYLFIGVLLLGFAGWFAHDGMYSMKTGKPVMVRMRAVSAIESFAYSVGAAALGICCVAAALGWIKPGPQGPR
jgi:hypothetical protein